MYSRITLTESPQFCMNIVIAILTKPAALLLQELNCSYYLSRLILATPPLWLHKHADLRAYDFAELLICDTSLWSLKTTSPEPGNFVKLMLLYPRQALRIMLRQENNGILARGRILKGLWVAGLPQPNIICLIVQLAVLQILTECGLETARYSINFVIIHHFYVMIDISVPGT